MKHVRVGETDGHMPLSWEYNIKVNPPETGWGYELYLSGSGPRPVVGSCGSGNEPSGYIKFQEFY
jgi:hypothetical protein